MAMRLTLPVRRLSEAARARINSTRAALGLSAVGGNDKVTMDMWCYLAGPRRMEVVYEVDETGAEAQEVVTAGPSILSVTDEEAMHHVAGLKDDSGAPVKTRARAIVSGRVGEAAIRSGGYAAAVRHPHNPTLAEILEDCRKRGGRFREEEHRAAWAEAKGRKLAHDANLHEGAHVEMAWGGIAAPLHKVLRVADRIRPQESLGRRAAPGALSDEADPHTLDIGHVAGKTVAHTYSVHATDQKYMQERVLAAWRAAAPVQQSGMMHS